MIHDLVVEHVVSVLQAALIDDVPMDDPARAGVVLSGPLQGDPDPDDARISVTVYENDPDAFYGRNSASGLGESWEDDVAEIECGGSVTQNRRFTVKARCLMVNTQEDKRATRRIASTVRARIERALLGLSFGDLAFEDEFVSRGAIADSLKGEMVQAGGPPDSHDYHIKVRFDIQTTLGVTP